MTDINHTSFAGESHVTIGGRNIDAPVGAYADALKVSNCTDMAFVDCTVSGGYEDALDINRGARLSFVRCYFKARGKFAATIKGGAHDVTFEDCTFTAGTETDIDLGNWSDQAPPPARTKRVRLFRCRRGDGQPLRIRRLWADPPVLERTEAVVKRVHPILLFFFRLAKRLRLA